MNPESPKPRILVVDDSMSIVLSISKILDLHGFEVETACNGSDALNKISQSDFMIAVCDIEMPGISGLGFLEKVRDEYDRELDVILMTGYLDQDYFIQAIRLGASDFIRKPLDHNILLHSINRILQRRQRKQNVSSFFASMHNINVHFEIDPSRYWQAEISKSVYYFLRNGLNLKRSIANELLLCLDEMLSNALIHGTLELSQEQRHLSHDKLNALVQESTAKLSDSPKAIHLDICLNTRDQEVIMSVEDDGKGFDYASWLIRMKTEQEINLDAHGRGISMLYHLSDRLEFDKDGRKVTIVKKLPSNHI